MAPRALDGSAPMPLRGLVSILFPPIFAFIYAAYLALLPIDAFLDRENYIAYAIISDIILFRNQMEGILAVLANEPLWLLMNIALYSVMDPEEVLRVFIFVPAFTTAFLILRRNPAHAIWMVSFLLFPLVIKNYIIHLRQGVAVAVFLVGYFSSRKSIGLGLMISAAFVHSSFFFVLMVMGMCYAAARINIPDRLKVALFMVLFILISIMLGYITSGLGARQWHEYLDIEIDVSGFAFLFWTGILVLLMSSDNYFVSKNIFPITLLALYVSTYFLIVVSGRIFESSVLLVLLAGLNLEGIKRNIFQGLIVVFAVANYAFRFDQPWLGWGV